jgi:dolichol-phosphate mannosyltransferase
MAEVTQDMAYEPTSSTRPDVTIVVPTYNERDRLDALVEQLFDACEGQLRVEVIIVDDNSPDGTGALADCLASGRRVRVIHRTGKLGLGSAVIEGFAIATADVVGAIDADLSHPPQRVPKLFAELVARDLDMVVASRYVAGGGSDGFPWYRRLMSSVACWLSRPVTPVRDAMSGFFLIRRDCLAGLSTSARGFKVGLELLGRAPLRRVGEMPYQFTGRTAGQSKMSTGEVLTFLGQLVALLGHQYRVRREPPQYLELAAPAPGVVAKSPSLDELGV